MGENPGLTTPERGLKKGEKNNTIRKRNGTPNGKRGYIEAVPQRGGETRWATRGLKDTRKTGCKQKSQKRTIQQKADGVGKNSIWWASPGPQNGIKQKTCGPRHETRQSNKALPRVPHEAQSAKLLRGHLRAVGTETKRCIRRQENWGALSPCE